jgi:hypothetical protein
MLWWTRWDVLASFRMSEWANGPTPVRATLNHQVKTALDQGLPPTVIHHTINILKTACNQGTYNLPTQPSIREVWELQEQIGFKNMAIGWMCNGWTRAFQTAGSDDREGCSVQLLTLIWQGLCEPIWALRNDILHRNPNPRVLWDDVLSRPITVVSNAQTINTSSTPLHSSWVYIRWYQKVESNSTTQPTTNTKRCQTNI